MAHVLEESTEKWWRFDDETVTAMPEGPVGEKADHGVAAAPGASAKKVQTPFALIPELQPAPKQTACHCLTRLSACQQNV